MKKALSIFLCILMCLPLVVGCTGSGETDQTETGTDTTQNSESVSTADAPKLSGIKIAGNDIAGYVIVKPADATESEAFAAEELAAYIEKACGAKLEIVTETTSAKTISIVRDTTGELGTDGINIKTEDGKLTITGGTERGCLNGVYEFLDSYIGWLFLPNNQEYLKTEGTVEIADDIDDTQVPILEYRYSYWTPYYNSQTAEADAAKQKVNARTNSAKYGGSVGYTGGSCHTFGYLTTGAHSYESQPCLTDEAVYQTMLANVLKLLSDNPGARLISVSQDDNTHYCTCDNCTAIALEEGVDVVQEDGTVVRQERQSGPIIRIVNRIAEAVYEAGYTEVKIHTFAYSYSKQPPSVTKCRDSVVIQLCSDGTCSQHALNDPTCNEWTGVNSWYCNNAVWAENLVGWGKICKTIYVWDYTTDYQYYAMPYPNFDVLAENMRFYVENNVKGVFSEGYEYNTVSIEFGDLRAYLTAKLMWNPAMTDEEYDDSINDFLLGYYGSAWREIRSYFDFAMESGDKRNMHFHENALALRLFRPMDYALHEEELEALFDRAEAACEAAGEPVQLRNIKYLRWGYEFMRLSSNYTANWDFGTEKTRTEYQADCKALYDAMVELESYYSIGPVSYTHLAGSPPFYGEPAFMKINAQKLERAS